MRDPGPVWAEGHVLAGGAACGLGMLFLPLPPLAKPEAGAAKMGAQKASVSRAVADAACP